LREILTAPERVHMRRFLGSYLIYEDGVNTVVTFAGVFAAKTLGFSFKEIILLFMLVQITALVGSALWARPTDSSGPRFVVGVTLVQWALVTVLAFSVQEKWHFWIVAILAGNRARGRAGGEPHLHDHARPARARGRVLRLLCPRGQDRCGVGPGGL